MRSEMPLNKGQKICIGISLYLILKPVCSSLFLGGSLAPLVIGIAALFLLYFGVRHSNTVIAVLLMLVACACLPDNIRNIGFNRYLIYLLEGIADMLCAVVLAFQPDVRKHCKLSN
ncbi:MAG: hypothetical protein J6Z40_08080 [Oscillospiraceae bacterium]|nr:hypothetical protein [Oscillospiraceae bacterium]